MPYAFLILSGTSVSEKCFKHRVSDMTNGGTNANGTRRRRLRTQQYVLQYVQHRLKFLLVLANRSSEQIASSISARWPPCFFFFDENKLKRACSSINRISVGLRKDQSNWRQKCDSRFKRRISVEFNLFH